MVENNGYDRQHFLDRAAYMRSFIDYSKSGRPTLDVGKSDLINSILDNVERPKEWGSSKTKAREYLKKVFSYCEEAQERAFLEGKSSIYTLNGYLYLKQIGAKKIGNKINAQFKMVPPKTKIEYRANERIRDLNEALRRMSFENVSPEDLGLNEDGEK